MGGCYEGDGDILDSMTTTGAISPIGSPYQPKGKRQIQDDGVVWALKGPELPQALLTSLRHRAGFGVITPPVSPNTAAPRGRSAYVVLR